MNRRLWLFVFVSACAFFAVGAVVGAGTIVGSGPIEGSGSDIGPGTDIGSETVIGAEVVGSEVDIETGPTADFQSTHASESTTADLGPERLSTPGAVSTNDSDDVLETTYFSIQYDEAYAEEAEEIASFIDAHYVTLHQKFSIEPPEDRLTVFVVPSEELPCGNAGCVDPFNRVWLSNDRPSLVHHELIHTIQIRQHGLPNDLVSGPTQWEGMIYEGTARYLDAPAPVLVQDARFDPDLIELTPHPSTSGEYAERALFVEYVLHEHGRAAFDALYLEGTVEALEAETGTDAETLRADFEANLDEQRERLDDGGTPLPAFTYDPFPAEPGTEIHLDARTPETVASLDRDWYPTDPDEFAWDLTGDDEIDATGPTATYVLEDGESNDDDSDEITLIVTIDGEEYTATQSLVSTQSQASVDDDSIPTLVDATFPDRAEADETITVSVELTAEREQANSTPVSYEFDGSTVETIDVDLEAGETRTVEIEYTVPEELSEGSYDHAITVGEQTIEETIVIESVDGESADQQDDGMAEGSDGSDEQESFDDSDSIPGFTHSTAIGVVALFVCLVAFRNR